MNVYAMAAVNVGGICATSAFAQCSGQLDAVSFVADYGFGKRFERIFRYHVVASVEWPCKRLPQEVLDRSDCCSALPVLKRN